MSCGELASQGGQPSHSSCRSKYHVTLLLEKKAWIFFDLVRFDLHSTEICSFKVWMFLMFETLGLDLRCCSGLRALWRVYQLAVETDPGHLTTLKPVLVRVLECCTFSLLFFWFWLRALFEKKGERFTVWRFHCELWHFWKRYKNHVCDTHGFSTWVFLCRPNIVAFFELCILAATSTAHSAQQPLAAPVPLIQWQVASSVWIRYTT